MTLKIDIIFICKMPHHIFDLIEVYRYFKSSLPFVGKDCPSKDMSVHILTQTLPSPPQKNNIYCQTNVSRKKQPHYLYVQEHLQCTERRNQHGLLRDFFFFFQWTFEKCVKWEMERTVKTLTAGQRKPGNMTRPSALSFCMETTLNSKLCLLLVSRHHNHIYQNL